MIKGLKNITRLTSPMYPRGNALFTLTAAEKEKETLMDFKIMSKRQI